MEPMPLQLPADASPVGSTTVSQLDVELVKRFIEPDAVPTSEALHALGLLTTDTGGTECCTVAGILLGTLRPDLLIGPGACIEVIHYAGSEPSPDGEITARLIAGPLDQQILDAYAFIHCRLSTSSPHYLSSIFEAIVNAAVHRDYALTTALIRVHLFDDHIEITSPGGPANGRSIEELHAHPQARNGLLMQLLGRLDLNAEETPSLRFVTSLGLGVASMLRTADVTGSTAPVFELRAGPEVRVTLPAQSA